MLTFTHNDISYTVEIPIFPVNLVVDHFVFMNGNGKQTTEKLLPNNLTELFFNLSDRVSGKNNWDASTPEIKDNIISGVRHTFFEFYPPKNFVMAGLRFKLFGFRQLFNEPAYHFTDNNFSANDVFGKEMKLLLERLYEAMDLNGVFAILNDWVFKQLSSCSLEEVKKWNNLEKMFHEQTITVTEQINKHMGYSHKHSIKLIKEYSGLSPKEIKSIYRFDKAIKEINGKSFQSWAGFADEHNYADQSHFIRDFKKYSGYTPSEFLKMKPREYYFAKVQSSEI